MAGVKVDVCHIPPHDPDNYHTIRISENALPAHISHGDFVGSCDEFCDQLCDDGDKCTIDHNGNCEEDGCIPQGDVDCNDSDACTSDSCNSANGCVNEPIDCDDSDPCTFDSCVDGVCVNAEIVCEAGVCNPSNGLCEIVECPCWTQAELQAVVNEIAQKTDHRCGKSWNLDNSMDYWLWHDEYVNNQQKVMLVEAHADYLNKGATCAIGGQTNVTTQRWEYGLSDNEIKSCQDDLLALIPDPTTWNSGTACLSQP